MFQTKILSMPFLKVNLVVGPATLKLLLDDRKPAPFAVDAKMPEFFQDHFKEGALLNQAVITAMAQKYAQGQILSGRDIKEKADEVIAILLKLGVKLTDQDILTSQEFRLIMYQILAIHRNLLGRPRGEDVSQPEKPEEAFAFLVELQSYCLRLIGFYITAPQNCVKLLEDFPGNVKDWACISGSRGRLRDAVQDSLCFREVDTAVLSEIGDRGLMPLVPLYDQIHLPKLFMALMPGMAAHVLRLDSYALLAWDKIPQKDAWEVMQTAYQTATAYTDRVFSALNQSLENVPAAQKAYLEDNPPFPDANRLGLGVDEIFEYSSEQAMTVRHPAFFQKRDEILAHAFKPRYLPVVYDDLIAFGIEKIRAALIPFKAAVPDPERIVQSHVEEVLSAILILLAPVGQNTAFSQDLVQAIASLRSDHEDPMVDFMRIINRASDYVGQPELGQKILGAKVG